MKFAYELVKSEYRKNVDLRDYKTIITNSIRRYLPNVTVTVNQREYIIEAPFTEIRRGLAHAIGHEIASHSAFWPYIVVYYDAWGDLSSRQLFRRKKTV